MTIESRKVPRFRATASRFVFVRIACLAALLAGVGNVWAGVGAFSNEPPASPPQPAASPAPAPAATRTESRQAAAPPSAPATVAESTPDQPAAAAPSRPSHAQASNDHHDQGADDSHASHPYGDGNRATHEGARQNRQQQAQIAGAQQGQADQAAPAAPVDASTDNGDDTDDCTSLPSSSGNPAAHPRHYTMDDLINAADTSESNSMDDLL